MNQLTDNPEVERPSWCPEGVWEPLRRDLVAIKCKASKASTGQIAEKYGIPQGKISHLMTAGSWRLNMDEVRQDLANGSAVIAYEMMSSLHGDLENKEKMGKMTIRDKSIVFKNMSDNKLNLTNGIVGSHGTLMQFNNFGDLKALFTAPIKKPGEA